MQLRAAPAAGRSNCRGRARQPERGQQRLRSGDLPRGGPVRRRRHTVEHHAAGLTASDEDHQHPEHEGSRGDRCDRVPEERRLRQLLERRAHTLPRQIAHLLRRRDARRDGATALENRPADHGWPARGVAWRSVRKNDALRVLPATNHVRYRPGGHRSSAARHHRERAPGTWRDLDLGSVAGLLENGRQPRARRRSQREHHHPRAGPCGVRVDARPRRVRSREAEGAGHHRMTSLLALALSLPCVYWTQGIESRAALETAAITRICVAPERAEPWRAAGFTVTPLTEAELASRVALPSPGITPRPGVASPTRSPWIVANGWQFAR